MLWSYERDSGRTPALTIQPFMVTDAQGRMLRVSERAVSVLGLRRNAGEGQTWYQALGAVNEEAWLQRVHAQALAGQPGCVRLATTSATGGSRIIDLKLLPTVALDARCVLLVVFRVGQADERALRAPTPEEASAFPRAATRSPYVVVRPSGRRYNNSRKSSILEATSNLRKTLEM